MQWDCQFKKLKTLIYLSSIDALNLEFLSQVQFVDVDSLWKIEEERQMPEISKN